VASAEVIGMVKR